MITLRFLCLKNSCLLIVFAKLLHKAGINLNKSKVSKNTNKFSRYLLNQTDIKLYLRRKYLIQPNQ